MSETLERIAQIRRRGERAIAAAQTQRALEEVRIRYLGRKAELPNLLRAWPSYRPRSARPPARPPTRRARRSSARSRRASARAGRARADTRGSSEDRIDVTLPADPLPNLGGLHLLTQTRREIEDVFIGLGFNVAEGPEVETVFYNFDALNTPPTHPSRQKTDTLLRERRGRSLRTRDTSPVQIRSMERQPPPLYIIVPGRVYRPDPTDATHTPAVPPDRGTRRRHRRHARRPQGHAASVRARDLRRATARSGCARTSSRSPSRASRSTSPASTAPAARWPTGAAARCARGAAWLEILGAGMVDPNVFELRARPRLRPRTGPGVRLRDGRSSGSRCSSTASPTCGCSSTTTSASWSSSA